MLGATFFKWAGWLEVAVTVISAINGWWWLAAFHLVVAAYCLPIGYRVAAVFGIRLPWVRDEPDL